MRTSGVQHVQRNKYSYSEANRRADLCRSCVAGRPLVLSNSWGDYAPFSRKDWINLMVTNVQTSNVSNPATRLNNDTLCNRLLPIKSIKWLGGPGYSIRTRLVIDEWLLRRLRRISRSMLRKRTAIGRNRQTNVDGVRSLTDVHRRS